MNTFVAIAPDGHRLYRHRDDCITVDLDESFAATAVDTVISSDSYFIP